MTPEEHSNAIEAQWRANEKRAALQAELAHEITNVLYRRLPTEVHANVCREVGWEAADEIMAALAQRGLAPHAAATATT